MIRGDSKDYDSSANWGTRQADADWPWIDAQLRAFAESHDDMEWGRTGFDGVLHAVQWTHDGLRKTVAVTVPNDAAAFEAVINVVGSADCRDRHGRWHARSETRSFTLADFQRDPRACIDTVYTICAGWLQADVPTT